ncbi:hypothetical protein Q1695_003108 [Nippostrongylus brasiliensis]|nr:hypothetical protein Q1695_003108 [Nippostrongylus brasiliensis]
MSLSALITNSDNLEEELSAEEFIKTLKKVDSQDDGKKAERSSCSSSSGSSSDLLLKMRSRFQHRATEPVFHTLATSAQETSVEQQSSCKRSSNDTIRLHQIWTLSREQRTDSAPASFCQLPQSNYETSVQARNVSFLDQEVENCTDT